MKKINYTEILNIKDCTRNLIAANNIFNKLKNKNAYARLYAQMQSGKTSVSGIVGELCLNSKTPLFKNIVYIISESSTYLNEQNMASIKKILRLRGVTNIDEKVSFYHRGDLKRLINDKNKINKLKKEKTLLIIDESHMAIDKKSLKGKLELALGYKSSSDLPKKWENQNISILTISATPFPEELIHTMKSQELNKIISDPVIYEPGDSYYGVIKMFKNNKIHQSTQLFNEDGDWDEFFMSKMIDFVKNANDNKFKVVIRNLKMGQVENETLRIELVNKLQKYTKREIKTIISNQKTKKDGSLKDLLLNENSSTNKIEIIFIIGFARAGLDLSTKHVYFVWDTMKSNTASVAQSLAGRCCGYNKEKDKVDIYCDKDNLKVYQQLLINRNDDDYFEKIKNLKITFTGGSAKTTTKTGMSVTLIDKKTYKEEKKNNRKNVWQGGWTRNIFKWSKTRREVIAIKKLLKRNNLKLNKKIKCDIGSLFNAKEKLMYVPYKNNYLKFELFKYKGYEVNGKNIYS